MLINKPPGVGATGRHPLHQGPFACVCVDLGLCVGACVSGDVYVGVRVGMGVGVL